MPMQFAEKSTDMLPRHPSEKALQIGAIAELQRMGMAYAASWEAGTRTPLTAKAEGLVAGEPDLRVYANPGRTLFVEMKRRDIGKVSQVQKDRHSLLRDLGFAVVVIWASDVEEVRRMVRWLVEQWLPGDLAGIPFEITQDGFMVYCERLGRRCPRGPGA